MAIIFHALNTRDSFFYRVDGAIYNREMATNQFYSDGYANMGFIEADDLDSAYAKSQNVDKSWRGIPCRSTSVGDIILSNGKYFIVAACGFDEIELR